MAKAARGVSRARRMRGRLGPTLQRVASAARQGSRVRQVRVRVPPRPLGRSVAFGQSSNLSEPVSPSGGFLRRLDGCPEPTCFPWELAPHRGAGEGVSFLAGSGLPGALKRCQEGSPLWLSIQGAPFHKEIK